MADERDQELEDELEDEDLDDEDVDDEDLEDEDDEEEQEEGERRQRGGRRDRRRSSSGRSHRSRSSGGRRSFGRRPRFCSFCSEKTETIDYKQSDLLRRYITDQGKIRGRRQTGTCARHQRMLSQAVKRARHMALLPYAGELRR